MNHATIAENAAYAMVFTMQAKAIWQDDLRACTEAGAFDAYMQVLSSDLGKDAAYDLFWRALADVRAEAGLEPFGLSNMDTLTGRDADFYAGDFVWRKNVDDLTVVVCYDKYLDEWSCEITLPDLEYAASYNQKNPQHAIDLAIFKYSASRFGGE